jgi:hypothetical protein
VPVDAKEVTLEHRTYQVSRENHTPSRDGLPEELIRGEMSSPKKSPRRGKLQGEICSQERHAPRRHTLPGDTRSQETHAPRRRLLLGEESSKEKAPKREGLPREA